jgi:hypothetical protein
MDQIKIAEWRAKAAAGTITIEEMREAILMLREGRLSAVQSSEAKRRTTARKQVKSAEELLKELESQC